MTALACAAVLSWRTLDSAKAASRTAAAAYTQALAETRRIETLRRRETRITEQAPPEPDLVARLQAALAAGGIEASRLASVSTTRPEPLRDTGFRRVTAPVTIEGVRPVEVARLVARWSDTEPAWVIASLTLTHEPPARGRSEGDGFYTARLVLENIHVAGAGDRPGGVAHR